MGFFDRFKRTRPAKDTSKREISREILRAINKGRSSGGTAHQEIAANLPELRQQARYMANNDGYYSHYINLLETNVVGPKGIRLNLNLKGGDGKSDKEANEHIENAFKQWSKAVTADGQLSFQEAQVLFERTRAVDGEVFYQSFTHRDLNGNFGIIFVEGDHVDVKLDGKLSNGNEIRSGVEFNRWGRPVAYHVLRNHPADTVAKQEKPRRIPAEFIAHAFKQDRPSQVRGIPEGRAAFYRLKALKAYEDAEIDAARRGAKMDVVWMFNNLDMWEQLQDEEKDEIKALQASLTEDDEQMVAPPGMTAQVLDNKHPTSQYDSFTKRTLHGVGSGLGVSYNILTGDLESTSYSSLREGKLAARDFYRSRQAFLINKFCLPILEKWLRVAMLTGDVATSYSYDEIIQAAKWIARGWEWVDPVKDAQATQIQMSMGTKTLTEVIGDQGKDIEDHIDAIQKEQVLLADAGLDFINNNRATSVDTLMKGVMPDTGEEDLENGKERD